MFNAEPPSHEPPIRRWAKGQALAVFHPKNSIEQQWRHLVLMALFNAPPNIPNGPLGIVTQPESPESSISTAPWRLIFTFAALDKVLNPGWPGPALQSQNTEKLKHIVYELWSLWISGAERNHPDFVWRSDMSSLMLGLPGAEFWDGKMRIPV
jgi:hypothetical protein